MIKNKHFKWMLLAALLLTGISQQGVARSADDLQDCLDQLAAEQSASGIHKGVRRAESVNIPMGLPVVDLSQFSSSQNREEPLTVSTSVQFANGTISSSADLSDDASLMRVEDGATVILQSSANVDASAASANQCKEAVGIYGGSTFVQYGDVTAPDSGTGVAIYLGTAADTYIYGDGTVRGTVGNPNGGTVTNATVDNADWTIGPDGDFTTINAAMNNGSVKAGHTLHVLEGANITGTSTVTKAVTIVGNGYASKSDGYCESLVLECPGIVVTCLYVDAINICDENITVERCCAAVIRGGKNLSTDGTEIRGCFITQGVGGYSEDEYAYGWNIHHNVIVGWDVATVSHLGESIIDHNIIDALTDIIDDDSHITNNIVKQLDDDVTAAKFEYNILYGNSTLSGFTTNKTGYAGKESELFVCEGNSYSDTYYQLATGSPAMGYANDNGDCGPWSGSFHYIINGIEKETTGLGGTVTLDLNKSDNPAAGIYKSLSSLFTAVGSQKLVGDLKVNVATGTYNFTVDDTTYPILLAAINEILTSTYTLSMEAPQATSGTIDYSKYTKFSNFNCTAGTSSYYGAHSPSCLVDENLKTKWCYNYSENPSAYVEFSAPGPLIPVGYELTTGDDTNSYTGRNPKKWVLKAKLNSDDEWTTIATVNNDNTLKAVNLTPYNFPVWNSNFYKYFRYEVSANHGNYAVQLSELRLYGTDNPLLGTNSQTIFNFIVSNDFILTHASEAANMQTVMNQLFEKVPLTNIIVLFNGNPLINEDFQVEPNDLLALKNIYQAFDGTNWTSKKWSFESNGHRWSDFPGVTFNDEGRVTEIDLSANGLVGECFLISEPQLSELTKLNLSRNQISGDLSQLVGTLGKLTNLNMSYNRLSMIDSELAFAEAFSSAINISYQNREYSTTNPTSAAFTSNVATMDASTVTIGSNMLLSLPSLFTYDFKSQSHCQSPNLRLRQQGTPSTNFATLNYKGSNNYVNGSAYSLSFSGVYSLPQDQRLIAVDEWSGYSTYSAFPVIFHYVEGDADMTGKTNVLDVQYTLNYILAPSSLSYFNYSAANTYNDDIINVQDIVCTVNIVLDTPLDDSSELGDSSEESDFFARSATDDSSLAVEGNVYAQNGFVVMNVTRPVSAIDIELQDVTTDEVGLMLDRRDFQMIGRNTKHGARFLIFSPTGKSLAPGKATSVLRMSGDGNPLNVECSDPEAHHVRMAIGCEPTGIHAAHSTITTDRYYNMNGQRVTNPEKGVYIKDGKKIMVK